MKITAVAVSSETFRKAGMTDKAVDYPLSHDAVRVVAHMNGVRTNAIPTHMFWASNEHMRDWMELLGQRFKAGLPIQHANGYYFTLSQLSDDL